ncbi:MAG: metallophosphoesterase [Candidatus Eisenbacteria bacterium]|nr:metallophosphoesterase [Candidatus Eisenbacteria bacterium]
MSVFFFASDLHGRRDRYEKLFAAVREEMPAAVLLGGDLLPGGSSVLRAIDPGRGDFVQDFLAAELTRLRIALRDRYPDVLLIFGNDDARVEEAAMLELAESGLWRYAHGRRIACAGWNVYGYSCVPPTPFLLKDWERYDVSRFVDPGSTSPEEGIHSVPCPLVEVRYGTIAKDLEALVGTDDLERAILLFHAPPYQTALDRAPLDGRAIDHVPLDPHVGSIAIRRFLEERQPRVSLHGHVHESARLTGEWKTKIGETWCLGGAHDGPELALVRFDPERPGEAERELL